MTSRPELQAEVATLRELLRDVGDASPIERFSLESRLAERESELASLAEGADLDQATFELLFGGSPVQGQSGIDVDFAGSSLQAFQKVIGAVSASRGRETGLGLRGPIPASPGSRFLLSDVARGSFGFRFRSAAGDLPLSESPAAQTIRGAIDLMGALADEETEAEEVWAGVDDRVLSTVRDFLASVAKSSATFRIRAKGQEFEARAPEQVALLATRAEQTRQTEREFSIGGRLLGVLPVAGRFELEADGEVLRGRLGPDVDPAEAVALTGGQVEAQVWESRVVRPGWLRTNLVLTSVVPSQTP